MNRRRFLATSALVSAGWPLGASPAAAKTVRKTNIDLDRCREVTKVPAVAVAGTIESRPIALAGGSRHAGKNEPVTVDTLFPAASLSKPVFALAVRDLARAGKLEWDRPLQDYGDLGLTGEARRITAAHILTHASGLPNWKFQADLPLTTDFDPGSRWQYSGEGFVLLQRVVEAITGTPIASHMRQHVLVQLGMSSSTFAWSPEMEGVAAGGHDRAGAPLEKSLEFYAKGNDAILRKASLAPETASYDEIVAAYKKAGAAPLPIAISPNMAGSLMTTAADYALVLKRIMADALRRPDEFTPRVNVNGAISWTLGLGVDRTLAPSAFFQWGDGPGFKHLAWIQPARKTALVFLTNGDRGTSLYSWLFRQLLQDDPAALYWI